LFSHGGSQTKIGEGREDSTLAMDSNVLRGEDDGETISLVVRDFRGTDVRSDDPEFKTETSDVNLGTDARTRKRIFRRDLDYATDTMVPREDRPRVNPAITLRDRMEDFTHSNTYRTIKKTVTVRNIVLSFAILFCINLLMDYERVNDAQVYTVRSQCDHPLVLYKDSSLKSNKITPSVTDFQSRSLRDCIRTSECYLRGENINITCITPIAYGEREGERDVMFFFFRMARSKKKSLP
jgi:hypothetical protein